MSWRNEDRLCVCVRVCLGFETRVQEEKIHKARDAIERMFYKWRSLKDSKIRRKIRDTVDENMSDKKGSIREAMKDRYRQIRMAVVG